jgi:hypothetical protein
MTTASTGMHVFGLLTMGLAVCRTASGQSANPTPTPSPPAYKQLRYDEDYRYLRDP